METQRLAAHALEAKCPASRCGQHLRRNTEKLMLYIFIPYLTIVADALQKAKQIIWGE